MVMLLTRRAAYLDPWQGLGHPYQIVWRGGSRGFHLIRIAQSLGISAIDNSNSFGLAASGILKRKVMSKGLQC
ncbi:MAG: hypothetical protein CMH52_05200 [Myxococcales bacterium]|nr:hypothetical protein [Myxococcales bacterium]